MIYLYPVFTFLLIFSVIALIRLVINFIGALLSTPPKKFELTNFEILFYAIILSYIITFIIHY